MVYAVSSTHTAHHDTTILLTLRRILFDGTAIVAYEIPASSLHPMLPICASTCVTMPTPMPIIPACMCAAFLCASSFLFCSICPLCPHSADRIGRVRHHNTQSPVSLSAAQTNHLSCVYKLIVAGCIGRKVKKKFRCTTSPIHLLHTFSLPLFY